MKKFFKVLLYIVGVIVLVIVTGAAIVSFRGVPKYEAKSVNVKIDYTPERVENGTRLASMLCRSCHLNSETGHFTGREMTEVKQFGKIFSKNITHAGIGKWTDGQLIYFLRTGLRPDGQYVPPYMPKLANISDEDMCSIVSFLRSDNRWVEADKTKQPECDPSFLTKFLTNIKAFQPFPYRENVAAPDTTDPVKYGEYAALYRYECYACHSNDFAKNDYFHPEKSQGFFGGGNKMFDMEGKEMVTVNITMDQKTGIGGWSEDDFVKAVKYGTVPGNQPALRFPMLPYSNLTDKEAKAIYAYIKTVPKQPNGFERKFN